MSSALAFAIPGRWTGGKREEDEMRRLMAQEAEAAKGKLSTVNPRLEVDLVLFEILKSLDLY